MIIFYAKLKIGILYNFRNSFTYDQFNEVYTTEMDIVLSVEAYSIRYKYMIWLAPGVGFVKIKEPIKADFGQPQTGWRIKELRSKNF